MARKLPGLDKSRRQQQMDNSMVNAAASSTDSDDNSIDSGTEKTRCCLDFDALIISRWSMFISFSSK